MPNVTLLTNARLASRLETSASGREVTGVVVEHAGADGTLTADIVVVVVRRDQLGGAAAAIGQRPASARPGQRLGRRRPPLHGPRQLGAAGHLEDAEPDGVPEDARVNDFYFGADDFRYPMGHISFVGKLDAVALSAGAPPIVPG